MGILEQKRKQRLRKVAEEAEASLNAGGLPNRYDEAISAWERMGEFEEAARVKELKKELKMDLEKKAIMFLISPILIFLGLIFIYFSYGVPDGPMGGKYLTEEEKNYWAPKCIDWLSDDHPYWMSDGSNMCFEYAKEWNYTTATIGALMIIGGIVWALLNWIISRRKTDYIG